MRSEAYHTALSQGRLERASPVSRVEIGQSVAFVHDLCSGYLPDEFKTCDVLYADIPWTSGFKVFNERAGLQNAPSYSQFLRALGGVLLSVDVLTILACGKSAMRGLPEPAQVATSKLNGADCLLLVYHGTLPFESIPTTVGLLGRLAKTHSRIGDFCCGYGRSGRIFAREGKTFVMSDHNPVCIGYIAEHANEWGASV